MSGILLYGFPLSANSHRVWLALSLLGPPFEERRVDLVKGEQRGEALACNERAFRIPSGGDYAASRGAVGFAPAAQAPASS